MQAIEQRNPQQALWHYQAQRAGFIPANAGRSVRSRLQQFLGWLDERGATILEPNLKGYKAHLEQRMTRSSVNAHITTIRARYRKHILKSNETRDVLYVGIHNAIQHDDDLAYEVTRLGGTKAYVDERLTRIENDLEALKVRKVRKASVKTDQQQGIWLTLNESRKLVDKAKSGAAGDGLTAVRDAAIITVMLMTGVRASELTALTVEDVRQTVDGQPVVMVREGKGAKDRVIPLGANAEVVRVAVDRWLTASGISSGWLFRGFTGKSRSKVRSTRMSVRALEYILGSEAYTIWRDSDSLTVRPHDLRRTYAERLRENGVALENIQALLGHESLKTTMNYLNINSKTIEVPAMW